MISISSDVTCDIKLIGKNICSDNFARWDEISERIDSTNFIDFGVIVLKILGKSIEFVPALMKFLFSIHSIITQNIHFRTLKTHRMSPWLREFGLDFLRSILGLKKPQPIHLTDRGRGKNVLIY